MQVTIESLMQEIATLKEANAELAEAKTEVENMLDYERNKFERQMKLKDQGIVRHLAEKLNPELESIRESIQYIEDDDRMRIGRRLDRIDKILNRLEAKANT